MAVLSNSKTKFSKFLVNSQFSLSLFLLLLLAVGIQDFPQLAVSESTINSVPGFRGSLPFQLETGYVGVDEFEDVHLFYYFVKSERNPKEDPCLGPLYFEQVEYDGTLPRLVLNPNSWTKIASIIFLDLPVGTGYSYGRTSVASHSNDNQACAQALQFLKKWFISHPGFLSNPFYVGGDSYSGITVPVITQLISNEMKQALNSLSISRFGYILGNPKTFPADENYRIPFSHGMGLISDELYESLKRNCGRDYQKLNLNSSECSHDLEALDECLSGINKPQILEKNCGRDSPQLRRSLSGERRALMERLREQNHPKSLLSALDCRGTIETWIRCRRNLPYEQTIMDSRPYHVNLSRQGYRSLIYSGDHDMVVPFQSTQAWIRDLNYSIIDDWRPWIVEDQYAGYTRAYSNKMTFATVKGGGHTAPEYRPKECYAMFKRWISIESL